MNSPSVTIRIVSGSSPSTGRMMHALDHHPAHERGGERRAAARARAARRPATSAHATKVENIAISPWAKLTIPVERKISTSASASAP